MIFNNNDNDLYIYFEVINQIEPDSCIDFGPFLKHSGCVSRQVKNYEISADMKLDAVDFFHRENLKVYGTIYNELISPEKIVLCDTKYELAMGIGIEGCIDSSGLRGIIEWISDHCKYFFTDMKCDRLASAGISVKDVVVDDNHYYIYFTGRE